jgi:hypothetical protein
MLLLLGCSFLHSHRQACHRSNTHECRLLSLSRLRHCPPDSMEVPPPRPHRCNTSKVNSSSSAIGSIPYSAQQRFHDLAGGPPAAKKWELSLAPAPLLSSFALQDATLPQSPRQEAACLLGLGQCLPWVPRRAHLASWHHAARLKRLRNSHPLPCVQS